MAGAVVAVHIAVVPSFASDRQRQLVIVDTPDVVSFLVLQVSNSPVDVNLMPLYQSLRSSSPEQSAKLRYRTCNTMSIHLNQHGLDTLQGIADSGAEFYTQATGEKCFSGSSHPCCSALLRTTSFPWTVQRFPLQLRAEVSTRNVADQPMAE